MLFLYSLNSKGIIYKIEPIEQETILSFSLRVHENQGIRDPVPEIKHQGKELRRLKWVETPGREGVELSS